MTADGQHQDAKGAKDEPCPAVPFDACDVCGDEYPSRSLDRWHLFDGMQVCGVCLERLTADAGPPDQ
jgi:uncharacterized CHY-type Zn-finger protein